MSRIINDAPSAQKTTILSAVSSFVGMMAAVPVALAIFSAGQPASAMQTQNTQGDSYAQYAKAYTEGYLANADQPQAPGCQDTQSSENSHSTAEGTAASYHTVKASQPKHHKMMSHKEWTKTINNSYNKHVSITNKKTNIYTKNINSNNTIDSNNTSNSSVVVKDSDGAVVNSNATNNGNNYSHTDVDNVASNNTVVVNDSFNKDSHDKTVIVKDSGNTTNTTNNTSIINDSFNHEKKTVNVNSNNTVKDNTYIKVEDGHSPHQV